MFGVGFEGLGGRGPWLRGMGVALHLTQGGFEEHVSEVLCVVSCGAPCDEIPVFTGVTKLEYGAVPHNSGENRNPMDRDSGGLNIMKHALETRPYVTFTAVAWEPAVLTNA